MTGANSDPITAYAHDIVNGKIPAGKYHKLACVRHLRDLTRVGSADFPYRLDLARAHRLYAFASRLRHYKGNAWAGTYIRLEPWQHFILGSMIGWVHIDTGLRRFRTAFHQLPRKNGKTLTAAVVMLYLTFFDGEAGADGFCVATKKEQARIVFNDCKQLVRSSGLRSRITILQANLHRRDTASKLEPIGADSDSTDGLNPACVCIDEMQAMKNRGLIDVFETATGARQQPMLYEITTFGDNPVSPWGDQNDYANKILDGVLVDESFFVFTAHADPEDDWTLPETARKANPNYAISVSPEDLAGKVLKAKAMPGAAAAYKQKHLNLLVNANAPWLSLEGWRAGQRHELRGGAKRTTEAWLAELKGQPCFVGVDLSSKIDLAAVAALFPPKGDRKHWCAHVVCFTPEDTLVERARRDRAPYLEYVKLGHLKTCPGNRLHQDMIRDHVVDLRRQFAVESVGFDPWNAGSIEDDLSDAGLQVVEVPQNLREMSQPSKEFEADVLDGLVDANSNPLLELMVANVVVQVDGKDNIYPTKKKSRGRIDGVIATVIARKVAGVEPKAERTFQMFVLGATP